MEHQIKLSEQEIESYRNGVNDIYGYDTTTKEYPLTNNELTILIGGAKWIANYPNQERKNPYMLKELKNSITEILKKIK